MKDNNSSPVESRLQAKRDAFFQEFNEFLVEGHASVVDRYHDEGPDKSLDTYLMTITERLFEVDAALDRIKDGTFGICRICGEEMALITETVTDDCSVS